MLYVGIDTASEKLDLAIVSPKKTKLACYQNDPQGHHRLLERLLKVGQPVRVVIEATGCYHLQVCYLLANTPGIEVMVLNPRIFAHFAKANNQRSKTDAEDAKLLALFAKTMPFEPWQPPSATLMELRAITRRIVQLTKQRAAERNHLHAAKRSTPVSQVLTESIQTSIERLTEAINSLEAKAVQRLEISADQTSKQAIELLCTVPGIGLRSALYIWAEIGFLPDQMGVRQWVAYAGLDPCVRQSGQQVWGKSRISKKGNSYLRSALFMPSGPGSSRSPGIQRFKADLAARGKAKMQIRVAVMRKLLHSIYGMLKSGSVWDEEKFRSSKLNASQVTA